MSELVNPQGQPIGELQQLRMENFRLSAILFSIMKRHPEAEDNNLTLVDIVDDQLPERMMVGWNVVGKDAIVTLLYGVQLDKFVANNKHENPTLSE